MVETAAVTNGAYTVICYGESDNTAVLSLKRDVFCIVPQRSDKYMLNGVFTSKLMLCSSPVRLDSLATATLISF